jgi:trehalose 6-phosphate synthase/phosphatase
MGKLIAVSNRLPVSITRSAHKLGLHSSVGGMATGLSSYREEGNFLWIGWPGIHKEELSPPEVKEVEKMLAGEGIRGVHLNMRQVEDFYEGFSNRTIWPLFHYFFEYTQFEQRTWDMYYQVNDLFCREVLKVAEPGDTIWVHDYQLMLLPGMLRRRLPDAAIGFFLHIPFPSFELFRLLPWRREILDGILGADLIGFHTYDYVRHFLSSIRRICGHEHVMGQVSCGSRLVKVDTFPMGIDYDKYSRAIETKKVKEEIADLRRKIGDRKVLLSVDRLDYTKGIIQRLEAFDWYLTKVPEMRGKVTMILLAVPSRTGVEHYDELRSHLEQLVGRVNGALGAIGWTPVQYLYRSMPFERLTALYHIADAALITPLRDGMNLIAKEYVAAKTDGRGVLILSEMAGASSELPEAMTVNANDKGAIVHAIDEALTMPAAEQKRRMTQMQQRLSRYTVHRWAHDFVETLREQKEYQRRYEAHQLSGPEQQEMLRRYRKARRRLLLLDYDGTLAEFAARPQDARPDEELMTLLTALGKDKRNRLVIISGRDRRTIEKWLGVTGAALIAEHGAWRKGTDGTWHSTVPRRQDWKRMIRPILEFFTDRTPGSEIEEKNFSLVWHYRRVAPELAMIRSQEIKDAVSKLIANMDLGVFEGNKILEIKKSVIHKGQAAAGWLADTEWPFILAAGDDYTDEDLFSALPEDAYSIKIGPGPSLARFSLASVRQLRAMLSDLAR